LGSYQRNPVYHDPPLQEKRGNSFEDLVRQFSAAPEEVATERAATEATATEAVHSDYETDPFIAPAPAVATTSAREVVDFTATELADDVEDDLSIDAFLRSKLGGEAAGSGASSPESVSETSPDGGFGAADREEGAAHAVAPVSDTGLVARADTRLPSAVDRMGIRNAAAAPAAPEVVIGFTDATAQTLVKIETALGSENPFESMKSTEAEISAQLRWTKPVEHVNDMSDQDLDSAFSSIEAVINQSASKVK
jgi:intracellular multiplication protein IcmO